MSTFFERKFSLDRISINRVDKEVQTMLLPLNLMQYITYSPKYCIKNNYIFPNNLLTYCLSLTATIFIIVSYITSHHLSIISGTKENVGFLDYLSFYDSAFNSIGFTLIFVIQIMQSKNSVMFVLMFQKVHRVLNNEINTNQTVFVIWTVVILTSLFFPCYFTAYCILANFPFRFLIATFFLAVFDFNIVYATEVIKLLTNKVDLWNNHVVRGEELEDRHGGDYYEKLFQTYDEILECYDIHNTCFRTFIMFYIVEVFNHSLVYVEEALTVIQYGSKYYESTTQITWVTILIFIWLLKNFLLLTNMIHQYEKFYIAVGNVQDTCTLILRTTNSDAEKRLCKNMLRLHRASFSKMSLYGMFHVDAALQQGLMMLLTEYTVVLLQFTFL
ncbi:unnamed protein product [Spodoptera littoralis]|uniref:Gustatory receptor n=1 Tax=Spodoptera littoralis TaxID=7109 RepID=A0A9P0N3V7_SPOLI|nr:unnamed protein product [Spodoptera littoralis]CAH1640574.1 unnamed protein product [Spodoptera littoralis]